MEKEDYLLRQSRDLAKFIALLTGLAKKGETEQAVKIIDKALKSDFKLDPADFMSKNNRTIFELFPAEDLKTIGELLLQKANLQPRNARFLHQSADLVSKLYSEKTEDFDLTKM